MKLQQLKWLFDKKRSSFHPFPGWQIYFFTWLPKKTINKKLNVTIHNKRVLPKRTEKQIVAAKTKFARLFKTFSDRGLILDDALFFKLTRSLLTTMVATTCLRPPRHNLSSNSILKWNSKVRSLFDCDKSKRFPCKKKKKKSSILRKYYW